MRELCEGCRGKVIYIQTMCIDGHWLAEHPFRSFIHYCTILGGDVELNSLRPIVSFLFFFFNKFESNLPISVIPLDVAIFARSHARASGGFAFSRAKEFTATNIVDRRQIIQGIVCRCQFARTRFIRENSMSARVCVTQYAIDVICVRRQ